MRCHLWLIASKVNLVIPGSEQPLVEGIESHFRKGMHVSAESFRILTDFESVSVGIPVFGPSMRAAKMEGSKAFAKAFMARHSIPTAKYRVFPASEVDQAIEYVRTCKHKLVLKADGLAAGKGVLIPETVEAAVDGLRQIMVANVFGSAGLTVPR